MTQDALCPDSAGELADIIRQAAASHAPLSLQGKGSKAGLGLKVEGKPVSLRRITGIVDYQPDEMVVTVNAGTPLMELKDVLRASNQHLAFEPPGWNQIWKCEATPTIGGTVAAAASGSRRFVAGAVRDHILGFKAVNGHGEVFTGGGKVVKNVTGYDLPKLAAGSFGTLFAMTEITLRALPKPQRTVVMRWEGQDANKALKLLRELSASSLEPTGLTFISESNGQPSQILCRFEGSSDGVSSRIKHCRSNIDQGGTVLDDDAAVPLYESISEAAPFFEHQRPLWRVCLPPAAATDFLSRSAAERYLVDWAGGLVWLSSKAADIHALAKEFGGHATCFRKCEEVSQTEIFQPLGDVEASLTRRLKSAFDPAGVLNPGRMHNGI